MESPCETGESVDGVGLSVRVPSVHTEKAALQNGVQEGGLGWRRNWEDFTPTMRLDQIAKGMSKDRALEPSKNKTLRREGA